MSEHATVKAALEADFPQYKCHKRVWALKIRSITKKAEGLAPGRAWFCPEGERYSRFSVTAEYMKKHEPQVGGYWVLYEDGYESFSPADVFERGYTLVDGSDNPDS